MPQAFDELSTVSTSTLHGAHFETSRQGDDYQEAIIPQDGDGQARQDWNVNLIYGSAGMGDEVYFSWNGNELLELPVAWLGPQKTWGIQGWADPNMPGEFKRTGTTRCLECHNTWFEHVKGTENRYRRDSFMFGVTCERCHGPGREHVDFHRSHPNAKTAHGLVNPEDLSRDRQVDVCGQCHSNTIFRYTGLFSFRPGDKLEDHFRSLKGTGLENDHVADQVKYLQQSQCFQGDEQLSCTTCHNPHRKTPAIESGNRACASCHQPKDCGAHEHNPVAVRDDCVSCHMPRYTRVAVRFHTNTDRFVFPMRPRQHRIGIYPEATQETLLNWYRTQTDDESQKQAAQLTTSLQDYWMSESKSLQKEWQFVAAIGSARESLRIAPSSEAQTQLNELIALQTEIDVDLSNAQRLIAEQDFSAAEELLKDVLQKKPNHAFAHGRLGTIYAVGNQPSLAAEQWRLVGQFDPDSAFGDNMLGWVAYLRGDSEEAIAAFQRADQTYPYTPEINYRWGLALIRLERWKEAEQRFSKVLEIDPNHVGACQGVSIALVGLRQAPEAVRFAKRAARLSNHENADVLLTLANAYAADKQNHQAIETAESALQRAMDSETSLVPQIRSRLQELRK
jgi:tetratricopeptide (TPR) repeat protein